MERLMDNDTVMRMRGLMATAEMDFRAISDVLGDGPQVSAIGEALDALVCIAELLTALMAHHDMTPSEIRELYPRLGNDLSAWVARFES